MENQFIAHVRVKNDIKEIQSVSEHLLATGDLTAKLAAKIGLEEYGELLGIVHDLGKLTEEFLNYIKSATNLLDLEEDDDLNIKDKKGKIDHSTAGAQFIYKELTKKQTESQAYDVLLQILPLIVASHHSGLIDCITPDGIDQFSQRMSKDERETRLNEAFSNLDLEIQERCQRILNDDSLALKFNQKISSMKEQNDSNESKELKIGLLIKFLSSCLIDADRINTADFQAPEKTGLRRHGKYVSWDCLIEKLELELSKFKADSPMNLIRRSIAAGCLNFASSPKGLYRLTVPTGGGKTLASLRFALHHARQHQMERIIYVIPFLSIIDQNAQVAREIFEDASHQEIVLEHHSNLTPEKETMRHKLLAENFDAPVIFTSMVQFMEILFGNGTRNLRRMHQLANSVLIFDEIQSLPIYCIQLFNLAIRFLVKECGTTAVLCSATQPLLDQIKIKERALLIEQQIIPNYREIFAEFKDLKKIEVFDRREPNGWTNEKLVALAKEELAAMGSVLIIVNTKNVAHKLYRQFENTKVLHLSTDMCPKHRREVLAEIKKLLEKQEPFICVSTSLIEAGVDLDFGCVIRSLAGLDSLVQAAGRVNRNCLRQFGKLILVNLQDEDLQYLDEIRIAKEKTERIFDDYKDNPDRFEKDLLGLKAIEDYYSYYFHERQSEMSYPISKKSILKREDTIFNLLATNTKSVAAYRRINSREPAIFLCQSFKTAAKLFKVINSPTQGVIVPYQAGKEIIEELGRVNDPRVQADLLKKAQPYSVNVFLNKFEDYKTRGIIREVQSGMGVFYLEKQYYDEECGFEKMDNLNL